MAEGLEPRSTLCRQISKQQSQGDGVSLELEFLQNVYFEDLQLTNHQSDRVELLFHITPNTGNDQSKKYTYLDLHLVLPQLYPEEQVEISIPTSRGIADIHLKKIISALQEKAVGLLGSPMVYELVEHAKDTLTDNNLPCGDCAVCLLPFHDDQQVSRTDCYHYFHIDCLARYVNFFENSKHEENETTIENPASHHQQKHLECPVCRLRIVPEATCLEAVSHYITTRRSLEPVEKDLARVSISQEIRQWQHKMARLLQKQQDKGGLINPSAKDEVIDETWVRTVPLPDSHSSPRNECGRWQGGTHRSSTYGGASGGYGRGRAKVRGSGGRRKVGAEADRHKPTCKSKQQSHKHSKQSH